MSHYSTESPNSNAYTSNSSALTLTKRDHQSMKTSETGLHLLGIDIQHTKNRHDHATHYYDIPGLVLRRGQTFTFTIRFNRDYIPNEYNLSVIFKSQTWPNLPNVKIPLNGSSHGWSTKQVTTDSNENNHVHIQICSPSNAVIGKYIFLLEICPTTKDPIPNQGLSIFQVDFDLYLLFNPWNKSDTCALLSNEQIAEYVMNEQGQIYLGSSEMPQIIPWYFGQFERVVLLAALALLSKTNLSAQHRIDSLLILRILSSKICSDPGTHNGVFPSIFDIQSTKHIENGYTSSSAILNEYMNMNDASIQKHSGTNWQHAVVFCSLCRSLGIPCRLVTIYNGTCGTCEQENINVHWSTTQKSTVVVNSKLTRPWYLWNECCIRRDDLPTEYSGWQVVDSSFIDYDTKTKHTGPCSVLGLKAGLFNFPWDTPNIHGLLNGDRVYWLVHPNGHKHLINVEENMIGTKIITKSLKADLMYDDITNNYKSMRKRNHEPIWHHDVNIDIDIPDSIKFGEDLQMTLKVKNQSSEHRTMTIALKLVKTNPIDEIKLQSKQQHPTALTGQRVQSDIKSISSQTEVQTLIQIFDLDKNEHKSIPIRIAEHSKIWTGCFDSLLKLHVHVLIRETGQIYQREKYIVYAEDGIFELSLDKNVIEIGQPVTLRIVLNKPLPYTLSNGYISIDGFGVSKRIPLLSNQKTDELLTMPVELVPIRVGVSRLYAMVSSDKLLLPPKSILFEVTRSKCDSKVRLDIDPIYPKVKMLEPSDRNIHNSQLPISGINNWTKSKTAQTEISKEQLPLIKDSPLAPPNNIISNNRMITKPPGEEPVIHQMSSNPIVPMTISPNRTSTNASSTNTTRNDRGANDAAATWPTVVNKQSGSIPATPVKVATDTNKHPRNIYTTSGPLMGELTCFEGANPIEGKSGTIGESMKTKTDLMNPDSAFDSKIPRNTGGMTATHPATQLVDSSNRDKNVLKVVNKNAEDKSQEPFRHKTDGEIHKQPFNQNSANVTIPRAFLNEDGKMLVNVDASAKREGEKPKEYVPMEENVNRNEQKKDQPKKTMESPLSSFMSLNHHMDGTQEKPQSIAHAEISSIKQLEPVHSNADTDVGESGTSSAAQKKEKGFSLSDVPILGKTIDAIKETFSSDTKEGLGTTEADNLRKHETGIMKKSDEVTTTEQLHDAPLRPTQADPKSSLQTTFLDEVAQELRQVGFLSNSDVNSPDGSNMESKGEHSILNQQPVVSSEMVNEGDMPETPRDIKNKESEFQLPVISNISEVIEEIKNTVLENISKMTDAVKQEINVAASPSPKVQEQPTLLDFLQNGSQLYLLPVPFLDKAIQVVNQTLQRDDLKNELASPNANVGTEQSQVSPNTPRTSNRFRVPSISGLDDAIEVIKEKITTIGNKKEDRIMSEESRALKKDGGISEPVGSNLTGENKVIRSTLPRVPSLEGTHDTNKDAGHSSSNSNNKIGTSEASPDANTPKQQILFSIPPVISLDRTIEVIKEAFNIDTPKSNNVSKRSEPHLEGSDPNTVQQNGPQSTPNKESIFRFTNIPVLDSTIGAIKEALTIDSSTKQYVNEHAKETTIEERTGTNENTSTPLSFIEEVQMELRSVMLLNDAEISKNQSMNVPSTLKRFVFENIIDTNEPSKPMNVQNRAPNEDD